MDDFGPARSALRPARRAVSVNLPNRRTTTAPNSLRPGKVRFAGRKAVVLARNPEGRAIRSQPLRLPALVVEEGSSADYDANGALITLRKQATAHEAGGLRVTRKQRPADGVW